MPEGAGRWMNLIGAACFGIVIGWVTYRTLRRNQSNTGLSDIATVIGALGGAAITGIFRPGTAAFGAYCAGLVIGFFGYLVAAYLTEGPEARSSVPSWLGTEPPPSVPGNRGGGGLPGVAKD